MVDGRRQRPCDVETHFLDCGIDTTSKKFDHEVKKGKVAEG
jgi:hypothetical protein